MADQKVGALWIKHSKSNGSTFYGGELEIEGKKIKVVAFINDRKTKETQPDIQIYLSEDPESRQQRRAAEDPEPNREALNNLPPTGSGIAYPQEDIDPNDIPF